MRERRITQPGMSRKRRSGKGGKRSNTCRKELETQCLIEESREKRKEGRKEEEAGRRMKKKKKKGIIRRERKATHHGVEYSKPKHRATRCSSYEGGK